MSNFDPLLLWFSHFTSLIFKKVFQNLVWEGIYKLKRHPTQLFSSSPHSDLKITLRELDVLLWPPQNHSSVCSVPCKSELWGQNQPGPLPHVSHGSLPMVIERGIQGQGRKEVGNLLSSLHSYWARVCQCLALSSPRVVSQVTTPAATTLSGSCMCAEDRQWEDTWRQPLAPEERGLEQISLSQLSHGINLLTRWSQTSGFQPLWENTFILSHPVCGIQ